MKSHPILGLEPASTEDTSRSVETDGSVTDLHAVSAARMFNVRVEEVTENMRRMGKLETYASLYGMSPAMFRATIRKRYRG